MSQPGFTRSVPVASTTASSSRHLSPSFPARSLFHLLLPLLLLLLWLLLCFFFFLLLLLLLCCCCCCCCCYWPHRSRAGSHSTRCASGFVGICASVQTSSPGSARQRCAFASFQELVRAGRKETLASRCGEKREL